MLGPARSGSGLHIDPLATGAWNALLAGRKRWALFPPGAPRALVAPREPGLEREAASWFAKVYPRARGAHWPSAAPVDIIQVLCVWAPQEPCAASPWCTRARARWPSAAPIGSFWCSCIWVDNYAMLDACGAAARPGTCRPEAWL